VPYSSQLADLDSRARLSETRTVNVRRLGGDRRCELCPFFAASGPKMLRHHVANAHVISSHYCPAGRKTLSIVYALHDADCAAGTRGGDYLRRAALAVRQSLLPGPSSLRLDIDRCMVLLLQSSGPTYVSSDVVVLRRDLRRVGYVYYDKGMAEALLREALLSRGRVRTLLQRIMLSATLQGSELVSLYSSRVTVWLKVLEDVLSAPHVVELQKGLTDFLFRADEYVHVSMDATVRIVRRIRGQRDLLMSTKARNMAPIGDAEAKRRVLTVLGVTGTPLATLLVAREATQHITASLYQSFTEEQRLAVRSISVDNPSRELLRGLQEVFPNLAVLATDPVHICMSYEQAEPSLPVPVL